MRVILQCRICEEYSVKSFSWRHTIRRIVGPHMSSFLLVLQQENCLDMSQRGTNHLHPCQLMSGHLCMVACFQFHFERNGKKMNLPHHREIITEVACFYTAMGFIQANVICEKNLYKTCVMDFSQDWAIFSENVSVMDFSRDWTIFPESVHVIDLSWDNP